MHHAGKIIPLRRESMRETAWGLLLTARWSSDIGQIYGILGEEILPGELPGRAARGH
jgi:hypothetical protein